jgi:HD-GYP domain-containing protein (c-di-GMP phosphodiesterase class II)
MPVATALDIMAELVGTAIDADCFGALQRALRGLNSSLAA